jgi:Predicted nucleic acid-binding protein, contains PIN domain
MIERLLDSVILIDHLNGIDKATQYLLSLNPSETAISVITRAEILTGLNEEDEALVKPLLDQYLLLIIDKTTADLSAKLRREYHWKLPDAFQAALSVQHKIKLVTRNTKDFNPEEHVFVEIPYLI